MKWLITTVIFTLLTEKSAEAIFNELETRLRAFEIKDRLIEMQSYTAEMKENTLATEAELMKKYCNIGTGLLNNPLVVSLRDSIEEVKNRGLDTKNCTELLDNIINEFIATYDKYAPITIWKRFFFMTLDMTQRVTELQTIHDHIHYNLDFEIDKCKRAENDQCSKHCICAIDTIFDDILISEDPTERPYLIFKTDSKKSKEFFENVVTNPFSSLLKQTVAVPVQDCLRILEQI